MKIRTVITGFVLALFSVGASAQLEPFKDYDIGEQVWNVTQVQVDANMGDDYLEGIRDTWVASNEVAKELGHIEDYFIFSNILPQSGDWNLLLVVRYSSMSDLGPAKEKYDAFMKAWGEANEEKTREISKNYPAMRKITGEYLMQEITMK